MIKLIDLLTEGILHYGCVMLYFDFPQLSKIHNMISDNDIYFEDGDRPFGLEDEPHITLLYGLHEEVSLEDVKSVLNKYTYSDCQVYNASLFQNEKYDVLKFDVKGKNLFETNRDLRSFPYTSQFDEYHPHMTIGYLKPGEGLQYSQRLNGVAFNLEPKYAVYSKADHTKTEIPIKIK